MNTAEDAEFRKLAAAWCSTAPIVGTKPDVEQEAWQKMAAYLDSKLPKFEVSVCKMKESHRNTWWVQIKNLNLPHHFFGRSDNPGYMTPYMSEVEEQAIHIASEYAKFLGVPDQVVCNCIMCDFPGTQKKKKQVNS